MAEASRSGATWFKMQVIPGVRDNFRHFSHGRVFAQHDGDALTFAVASAPTLGTVVVTDASTGAFTFTPNPGAMGYDTFTFEASDGEASSVGTQMIFIVARYSAMAGRDATLERSQRRHAGKKQQPGGLAERGRTLRRVLVGRHHAGGGRHERRV